MRAISAISVISAVIACGCAAKVATDPVPMTPTLEEAAQKAVRNVLKDPDSAQFSGVPVAARSKQTGNIRVCGYVNAKNSYGGYNGSTRYVADIAEMALGPMPLSAAIGSPGQSGDFAINVMCSQAGL